MKKIILLFLLITSHIIPNTLLSNSSLINLKVGNVYIYSYSATIIGGHFSGKIKSTISKDTIVNNKKYYYLNKFPDFYLGKWVRQDPITYSLYYLDKLPNCNNHFQESLLDSFVVQEGSLIIDCNDTLTRFDSLRTRNLFSRNTNYNYYNYSRSNSVSISNSSKVICDFFGIYKVFSSGGGGGGFSSSNYTLNGCVIDGVLYGDTSTTNISQINEISSDYCLNQNYPNPFNPETNISFSIKEKSKVKLFVFDNLGRVVTILVNSSLSAGTYNFIFNGENFPSGIYYYKLESENYKEIKKMILMK
ncbi:MAG TPA: T9SS type A sorting domain-containing protein [Ignavibacteria bacterium]|nr:T9SS type A sorting domain-containing protein [Ignavibacteria bacterium]